MIDNDLIHFAAAKLGFLLVWHEERWWVSDEGVLPGCRFNPFTDWDVLRQGMEKAQEQKILWDIWSNGISLREQGDHGAVPNFTEKFNAVADIPRAFWVCWYQLEHPQ